jgi:hypothetical protein
MSTEDIPELLHRWAQARQDLADLEKRIEKYKKLAGRIMDKEGVNTMSSDQYKLKRANMSRMTISKQDVPEHIWKQYAKPCSYAAFYLSEK